MSNLTNSHSKPQRLLAFLLAFLFVFTSMITIFPTHAHAAETPPVTPGGPNLDGDAQEGVAGSDSDKDNSWDGSGAWRVYIAESNDVGTIKYGPEDVSNQSYPWEGIKEVWSGMMDKLHSRGSSTMSSATYSCVDNVPIPTLGASQAELQEFWEVSDYSNFKEVCRYVGWPADEIIAKIQSAEYVIVMEPVGWFVWGGNKLALSATECAILNGTSGGLLKSRMGSLTHNALPGYAWFETTKWGIPAGHTFSSDGMSFWLDDSEIRSTFGIARVESLGGMCCPHDPQNCLCYKNAKPPNTDPPSAPANCKCFYINGKRGVTNLI